MSQLKKQSYSFSEIKQEMEDCLEKAQQSYEKLLNILSKKGGSLVDKERLKRIAEQNIESIKHIFSTFCEYYCHTPTFLFNLFIQTRSGSSLFINFTD